MYVLLRHFVWYGGEKIIEKESSLLKRENERIDQMIQFDRQIIQSDDTFALSTDTLFLAYFARVRRRSKQKIVDFCSGNGALPLLLSSWTAAPIFGVEIQEDLADMSRRSVQLNGLGEQIQIITANIRVIENYFQRESMDLITCNPPYFKVYPDSWINPNDKKALARHELTMTLEDIFAKAFYLLKDRGRLCVVHRPERLTELIVNGSKYHLVPKRIRLVYPKPNKSSNMVLIDFIKNGKEKGLDILPPLYVYQEDGSYSLEVQSYLDGTCR